MNIFKRVPRIAIKYNRFLDPIFIFYCKNNPELKERGWNDWKVPTKEKVLERVEKYKEEWKKDEKKILNGLCNVTGLGFKRDVIDVYIVSGNCRQFSDPMVIKSGFPPAEFVDTLIHEIIHQLFQQNINVVYKDIFRDMFPNESDLTKSHVIVYAILKYIYLDVLKDESRLEKSLANASKHKTNDYTRAWDIVEEKGYVELIDDFKSKMKRPSIKKLLGMLWNK